MGLRGGRITILGGYFHLKCFLPCWRWAKARPSSRFFSHAVTSVPPAPTTVSLLPMATCLARELNTSHALYSSIDKRQMIKLSLKISLIILKDECFLTKLLDVNQLLVHSSYSIISLLFFGQQNENKSSCVNLKMCQNLNVHGRSDMHLHLFKLLFDLI